MHALRTLLASYAAKQANMEQVVRLMLESSDWYLPATFAVDKFKKTAFDHAIILSTESSMDPKRLLMFTDREAAARAEAIPIGMFVGRFSGVDVFDLLNPAELDRVDINPGSPVAETWHFGNDAFELVQLWSRSIRLEQKLVQANATYVPFKELHDHPGFLLAATREEGNWFTTKVTGMDGDFGLAFTAPDRWTQYCDLLGQERSAKVKSLTVSGKQLFPAAGDAVLQGIVVNAGSKGTVVLPANLFNRIAAGE